MPPAAMAGLAPGAPTEAPARQSAPDAAAHHAALASLLRRFLPFRARAAAGPNGRGTNSAEQQQQQHRLLEVLREHPLYQLSSLHAGQAQARPAAVRLSPAESSRHLLAFARLAADAEGEQRGRHRRCVSPVDAAAELQALYTLATQHAAALGAPAAGSRRSRAAPPGQLPDGEVWQLLMALASMEDEQQGGASQPVRHRPRRSEDLTAVALSALQAFAKLADEAGGQSRLQQQQQQQASAAAPGQLHAGGGPGQGSSNKAAAQLTGVAALA